ncbi:MAG: polymer-forming cytoskeletal protein [Planctomycetes bacterium]|nr:polymer-forming cytoskeletal protein [Planctomycetota bacterium]
MSVFCDHCRKRLILENYVIKSYQAVKGYATCGDVSVEKRGRVAAPIQSNSLTVKGKVNGNVEARGKVEVTSTGSLEGHLKATSLLVLKGASFDGYCEIRPSEEPAAQPSETEAVEPAKKSPKRLAATDTKIKSVRAVTTTRSASTKADAKPKSKSSTTVKKTTKIKAISTRRRKATTPSR